MVKQHEAMLKMLLDDCYALRAEAAAKVCSNGAVMGFVSDFVLALCLLGCNRCRVQAKAPGSGNSVRRIDGFRSLTSLQVTVSSLSDLASSNSIIILFLSQAL